MELNYDEMIILDAEELAEGGIKEAYEKLFPELQKYIFIPAKVEESLGYDPPKYTVKCNAIEYLIYGPELESRDSWERATVAFFDIINRQIRISSYRFYALYSGNSLAGIFLTPQQAETVQQNIANKIDWPYIPSLAPPWYGSFHD